MFTSILTGSAAAVETSAILICLLTSLVCGLIVSSVYGRCGKTTKGFLITIALLPAVVQMIILMVNGNLGVGVAVAGSFSLVRFRSLPGKASDILVLFLVMGLGLCTGMGYVTFALACAVILSGVYFLYSKLPVLESDPLYRHLRITIPEDLEYTDVFRDIFAEYTKKVSLESVRTVNLGTMYQVNYEVELKDEALEKKMIDAIRVRNGNLNVISGKVPTAAAEL